MSGSLLVNVALALCLQSHANPLRGVASAGPVREEGPPVPGELADIRRTGAKIPQRVILVKRLPGVVLEPGMEMHFGKSDATMPKYWLMTSRKPVKPPANSFVDRRFLVNSNKEDYIAQDTIEMFARYFRGLGPILKAKKKIDFQLCGWDHGPNNYGLYEVLVDHTYYCVLNRYEGRLPERSLSPSRDTNGHAM